MALKEVGDMVAVLGGDGDVEMEEEEEEIRSPIRRLVVQRMGDSQSPAAAGLAGTAAAVVAGTVAEAGGQGQRGEAARPTEGPAAAAAVDAGDSGDDDGGVGVGEHEAEGEEDLEDSIEAGDQMEVDDQLEGQEEEVRGGRQQLLTEEWDEGWCTPEQEMKLPVTASTYEYGTDLVVQVRWAEVCG
jgi:hypothetical protein